MFDKLQQNLQPYLQGGNTGLTGLLGMLGLPGGEAGSNAGLANTLRTPFSFDPSQLENTPGYQFTLQQGLKSLNNQNSAQGLGLSGAQQKGLLQYATGLANQTYGDQYNRALQQFTTNYGLASDQAGRLASLTGLGQNAAAGLGNAGMNNASNINSLLGQGASSLGSGGIGAANAQASIFPNIANMGLAGAGIYGLLNAGR